jgi:hypothetical protein
MTTPMNTRLMISTTMGGLDRVEGDRRETSTTQCHIQEEERTPAPHGRIPNGHCRHMGASPHMVRQHADVQQGVQT